MRANYPTFSSFLTDYRNPATGVANEARNGLTVSLRGRHYTYDPVGQTVTRAEHYTRCQRFWAAARKLFLEGITGSTSRQLEALYAAFTPAVDPDPASPEPPSSPGNAQEMVEIMRQYPKPDDQPSTSAATPKPEEPKPEQPKPVEWYQRPDLTSRERSDLEDWIEKTKQERKEQAEAQKAQQGGGGQPPKKPPRKSRGQQHHQGHSPRPQPRPQPSSGPSNPRGGGTQRHSKWNFVDD